MRKERVIGDERVGAKKRNGENIKELSRSGKRGKRE
jgi:hypothetical protein